MRKLFKNLLIFILLLVWISPALALEVVRQKNVATYISFPIVNASGDFVTGATGLDSEKSTWADGSAPGSFSDCTNEATEIGTNGVYYLSLTQTEMNNDYVQIQIKTTSTGAKTQFILIRTIAGDPKAAATVTTAGNSIDVASTGEVGLDFSNVKNATGSTTLSNITIPTVTDVTNAVGVKTGTGANQLDVTSGRIKADTVYWNASAVATPDTSGYPKVTIKSGTGSGEVSLSSGAVTVGTNNDKTGYTASTVSDKTGYSLTQSFPTNFSSLSIDSSGRVTPVPIESMILHSGTAQAGAAGTITLASGASSTDDIYKGQLLKIYGATGAGQTRTITAYNGTTKVASVAWNWITNPDATSTYAIIASGNPSINSSLQVSTTASDPWATALPGSYGAGTAGNILGNNLNATVSSRLASSGVPTNFSSMSIDGSGRVDLGKWIGSAPNALISGRVDSNAQVVGDKTGYTASTVSDKTGYSLSGTLTTLDSAYLRVNTAQAGAAGSITLDASASATDSLYNGNWVCIMSSTGAGQCRLITAYTGSTKVATVTPNWTTNPTSSSIFAIMPSTYISAVNGSVTVGTNNDKTGYSLTQSFPSNFSSMAIDGSGRIDLGKWIGTAPNALISGRVDSNAQVVGDKTGYSLTQSFPTNFSSMAITAGGAVTVGTNNDKTGYALTQTFPTNFSSLSIDGSGRTDIGKWLGTAVTAATTAGKPDVVVVTNNDKTGYTASTVSDKSGYSLSSAGIGAIWNEPQSSHTTAGTFGKYLDAQVSGVTAPSAATVAAAVWEETSSHTTTNTMGKKLNDASSAGNPWDVSGICSGLTAGQCLSFIKDSTDGDKEGIDYTGIEKTIRAQR